MLRKKAHESKHTSRQQASEYIPDSALRNPEYDRFDHEAAAAELANIVSQTATPYAVAIYAPWGAGKTSLGHMLYTKLDQDICSVATFNAWKYAAEPLKRHFITRIANELGIDDDKYADDLYQTTTKSEAPTTKDIVKGFGRLLPIVGAILAALLVGAALVHSLLVSGVSFVAALGELLVKYWTSVVVSGSLVAVVYGMLGHLGVISRARKPPEDEELEIRFRELIDEALNALGTGTNEPRIVIFVDEIDRCRPKQVMAVLESLKTFLDVSGCAFVVAADRDFLQNAVETELPKARDTRSGSSRDRSGEYLDKIFQHQITLPPLHVHRISEFVSELIENREGVWALARANNVLEDLIDVILPTHIRNPRRAKVLLNGFVSMFRIARARHEKRAECPNPDDRLLQIAKLSTLQLEFPDFYSDLRDNPQLATYLSRAMSLGAKDAPIPEELAVRAKHFPGLEASLGRWIQDSHLASDERLLLLRYLDRTSSIPSPGSDLIHMDSSAAAYGLEQDVADTCLNLALDNQNEELAELLSANKEDRSRVAQYLLREAGIRTAIERENLLDSLLELAEVDIITVSQLGRKTAELIEPLITRRKVSPERLPIIVSLASQEHRLLASTRHLITFAFETIPAASIDWTKLIIAMFETAHLWKTEIVRSLRYSPPGAISLIFGQASPNREGFEAVFNRDSIEQLLFYDKHEGEREWISDYRSLCQTANQLHARSVLRDALAIANELQAVDMLNAWLEDAHLVPESAVESEELLAAILYSSSRHYSVLADLIRDSSKCASPHLVAAMTHIRLQVLKEGLSDELVALWQSVKSIWESETVIERLNEAISGEARELFNDAEREERSFAHSILYEAAHLSAGGAMALADELVQDYVAVCQRPLKLTGREYLNLITESKEVAGEAGLSAVRPLMTALESTSSLMPSASTLWLWTLVFATSTKDGLPGLQEAKALADSDDWYAARALALWIDRTKPQESELLALIHALRSANTTTNSESAHLWRSVATRLEEMGVSTATSAILAILQTSYPRSSESLEALMKAKTDEDHLGRGIIGMLKSATRYEERKHILRTWSAWRPESDSLKRSLARAMTSVVRRKRKGDLRLAIQHFNLVKDVAKSCGLSGAMRSSAKKHTELRDRVEKALTSH